MNELYVEVVGEPEGGFVSVPLETFITLFTIKYLDQPPVRVILVARPNELPLFRVKVLGLSYEVAGTCEVPGEALACRLPVVLVGGEGGGTCVAGLCAVLRQIVKSAVSLDPGHWSRSLLGFRAGCLVACAESSGLTRFCEVDMINSVKRLVTSDLPTHEVHLPDDVVRLEAHMTRVHKLTKQKKEQAKSRGQRRSTNLTVTMGDKLPEHCFAEGPLMTLTDVILFPCMHIILESIRSVYLQQHIPLIMKWFEHVLMEDRVEEAISIIRGIPSKIVDNLYVKYVMSEVPQQSLYKSDPRRYRPRSRVFTRQEEVDASLQLVADLGLVLDRTTRPFGSDVAFDWGSLPQEAWPVGGHLPPSRTERKSQQLENLTKAVLKVARPGHTIVDFCSGSGHLGIVLAHLLPRCHVVLLENKEESLGRARSRVHKLRLVNVSFCQCNLDYFDGHFDVGTSLHACGVATDLVIQRCIRQRAVFVCCPCCYGSVQNNHVITYPRSRLFRESSMTLREYLVLGHSADQTHDDKHVKTEQGNMCMGIIDEDRCLQAREAGYLVSLAKLIPESCTPKNNLLVGVPREWHGLPLQV